MTDYAVGAASLDKRRLADRCLKSAALFWFLLMAIGQWLFVAYILGYYGELMLSGGIEALNETHLPGGYIPGDTVGNAAVVSHVLLAAVIIGGGPLQFLPKVRAHFPAFHRWNGRIYMAASMVTSLAGLYMTWFRERRIGTVIQDMGTSTAGILILVFMVFALRSAMQRNFKEHRKWALRLFMVVSAVWFVRLMTYGWIYTTGGVGIDFDTFSGPFLYIVSYAQWILPLMMLELYFWAQERAPVRGRFVVAGSLFALTVIMAIGIFAVASASWIPRM